jgi:hypothetical protein
MTYVSGSGPNPATTLAFIGPVANVAVANTSTKVHVTSHRYLGALATAANSLNLYICYQPVAGALTSVGGGMLGAQVPANTRIPFGMSAVVTGVPAGTYNVGLCGSSTNANWTNNEWGYTSVIVSQ